MPFKANTSRRHHIPRQRHRVLNWAEYDAALRARGSLTIWFTQEAVERWRAETRTTPGGQRTYSDPAITTALILRALFRLPLRQTEGLIGSIIELLGVELGVPDHSTISRRTKVASLPVVPASSSGAVELLVDGTGVKFCGPGEYLLEKHGIQRRHACKKPHIGLDAVTGRIVTATLTDHDADDGSQVGALLDLIEELLACFVPDGAYDQNSVSETVAEHTSDAAVIVPPRFPAMPSANAETNPTRRDRHLQHIAEHGRMAWRKSSRYNVRALVEAFFSRWKRVIGDGLRFRTDDRRNTEIAIAVRILNHMLDLGRPDSVRVA
jgi:hypothetical protein